MHRLTKHRLRLLDALVAEHIFGWKWFSALGEAFLIPPWGQEEARNFHVHWTEGLVEKKWLDRKETTRKCKKGYDIELHYTNYSRWEIPHYSTLREDAFMLLEHVGKTHAVQFWQSHEKDSKDLWFVYNLSFGASSSETLQLSAVFFALKINKIEIPWKSKLKPRVKVV